MGMGTNIQENRAIMQERSPQTDETDRKLYTDAEVYDMLGLSKTKWFELKKAGLTPKPLKLPESHDYYPIEAIDRWRLRNHQGV